MQRLATTRRLRPPNLLLVLAALMRGRWPSGNIVPAYPGGGRNQRLRGAIALFVLELGRLATAQEAPEAAQPIGTWAFLPPGRSPNARTMLDLRALNERIAGQTGFVKRTPDGSGFARGDGTPLRFWAVGSELYMQSPAAISEHVRFLARIGVNLVRLHASLCPKAKGARIDAVDEKQIDGIWQFVAAAKKEGIYTTISPYWATAQAVDGWGIEGLSGASDLWGLLFFNETLQRGYKAWVRALYSPKNPYTGIPLARDPAVALIQVQNEDSLLFWTSQSLKPEQQQILGKKFGTWLVKKYGSLEAARKAWDGLKLGDDDFDRGRAGLLIIWEMTQPQSGGKGRRVSDQLEFFAETQHSFYADIAAYYRDTLGCGQLINACNWKTADPIKLEDVERWTYTSTDVIAVNRYYGGGAHTGENTGWQIAPGQYFSQQSALLNPRDLPTSLKQVAGYPMIITEGMWVLPLAYQAEGPFLVSVYQSLTGIDALYWFTAHRPGFSDDTNFKFSLAGPLILGSFPAAALLYRNGYVKQGEPAVHEERPLQSLWERDPPVIAEDRSFDPNRDRGHVQGSTELKTGVDPLAFLVGPVEVKFGGDPARTRVIDLDRYIDKPNRIVRSVTGEITLDYGKGLCTVDAPKAQGACGFLSRAGVIRLRDVAIRSRNGYATVLAVAMDDQPIASSRKILIQAVTSARPTGWRTRAADFPGEDGKTTEHGYQIVNAGTRPWRVVNSEIGLVLRNPSLSKATLLEPGGDPAQAVSGTRTGADFSIQLPLNTMYLIVE